MDLSNKVAIVTGGSRDIGGAISIKLASLGAKVSVNYKSNEAAADKIIEMIEGAGGTAIKVKADVTKLDDVITLVEKTQAAFGQDIDILANVAGGLVGRKTLSEMDENFLDTVMGLNMTSTFLMTKHCVPFMKEGASIINIASQAGRDGGGPGATAYAASKAAVMSFTRSMAKELGPQGIRINALCPGMISTTFHDTFSTDNARANAANATPLKREGKSEEVADFVSYLASSESSFVHGACLDINGGLLFS